MRCLLVVALIGACGDHGPAPQTPTSATAELPALAFAPEHPTYLLAAPQARSLLAWVPIAALPGLDLDASAAVFSEHLDPTLVVHLADVAAARGALAQVPTTMWNIAGDWLSLHLDVFGDTPNWATRGKGIAADAWAWAKQHAGAARGALGFIDLKALAALPRLKDVAACVQLAAPLGRAGVSLDGDLHHVELQLTTDVGAAAPSIAAATVQPPGGWGPVVADAPLAAAVNLDVAAVGQWLAPCTHALGIDLPFDGPSALGARAGRVAVLSIDRDNLTSSKGVVALDLTSKAQIAKLLDKIPMRSQLESDRKFGAWAGHRIASPFTPTIDYVLDDHLAIVALGDGLLDRVAAPPPSNGPAIPLLLFAIDAQPSKLPPDTWSWLVGMTGLPFSGLAAHLTALSDAHISLALAQTTLALDLSLTRR